MKIIVKIFTLLCFVAISLCNPVNVTGTFVECEIVPEEISRNFIKEKSVDTRGGRVVYGNLAAVNQFPYFGYTVLYRNTVAILCGSSLISSTYVITASHCMRNVTAGQIYFGTNDNQVLRITQAIRRYIVHPQWNPNNLANDIAVAQLYAAVPLSVSVQPIRLPTRSQVGLNFAGVTLISAGFGKTATENLPRYLQFTYINGMTYDQCLAAHWVYTELMICGKSAYATGSSVCSGDSGGPLAQQGANISILYGINSYVQTASCINDIQGFTRVGKYLDWISYNTGIYISN